MPKFNSGIAAALALLIAVATAAGIIAAYKRFHVEASNRRVEIALEWQEIVMLAQASNHTVAEILEAVKKQHVTTIVIAEDTITTLEQSGAVRPVRTLLPGTPANAARIITIVEVDSKQDIDRIFETLARRNLQP